MMNLAQMIRFFHFRRDGRRWIVDLELDDGHTWMGYGSAATKRALTQELEAVFSRPVQFGTNKMTGWL